MRKCICFCFEKSRHYGEWKDHYSAARAIERKELSYDTELFLLDLDPAFECVNAFASALKKAGITVNGKITTVRRAQLNGKNYPTTRNYFCSIWIRHLNA